MPVQLQMAQPADLAGEYLSGVKTGAAIRAEQNRLQQEQQQEAQKLQMASKQASARLQEVKQEHDIQQQRIQVAASYNQQKSALRKQQLDQVAQVNDKKTKAAARQFEARQTFQREFSKIDADESLNDEQRNAAKTRVTMQLAPMMGTPGTEASAMLRDLRPPKPTVPASVEDKGDFMQVTQPNGMIQLHPKPHAGADNVKVTLEEGAPPVTMSKSQALQVIPNLPPQLQTNAVNRAVLSGGTKDTRKDKKPSTPKVGDVYKGHRFLGGNPSQQENWEKVEDESTQD